MAFKEMDKKTLEKVHAVGLEILIKIDEICKKYDIPYFLCGGTLLGSIRHKGFIPWDDDIDIGMLRKDYIKFQECFLKENPEDLFLHSYETDDKYWIPFMKVRKNGTTINEKMIEHLDTHKGLFVDIFPFDEVPDDGFSKLRIRAFLIKLTIEAIFCKRNIKKVKETRRPYLTKIMCLLSTDNILNFQKKLMTKYNNKGFNHCICYVGTYNTSKEYIKISDIYPTKKGLFENKKFNIPNNPDVYLTNLYNNYMELPPKEKRVNHNPVDISFNKGKIWKNGEINENKKKCS